MDRFALRSIKSEGSNYAGPVLFKNGDEVGSLMSWQSRDQTIVMTLFNDGTRCVSVAADHSDYPSIMHEISKLNVKPH